MSTDLMEKVESILKKADLPNRHTAFQIQRFVIGKEPTGQAQLWAIVRELEARKETVESYQKDLETAEDNLELFDVQIERLNRQIRAEASKNDENSDLNIQELEINIRKLQREKESLINSARKVNKNLRGVIEEMNFLVSGYDTIVSQIGEVKPKDDEECQKEYWNEKYLEEFNLRVLFQRPLDPEYVRSVLSLHDDSPVKKHVISVIDQIQRKMISDKKEQRPEVAIKPQISGK